MLRSIYRWLVRCHPPCFRMCFGEQMLSIFDQVAGTAARLALITDGLVSVLRQWSLRSEYRKDQQTESLAIAVGTGPVFQTLSPYRPRKSTLVNGAIVAGVGYCILCLALQYNWTHPVFIPFKGIQFAQNADEDGKRAAFAPLFFLLGLVAGRRNRGNRAPCDRTYALSF